MGAFGGRYEVRDRALFFLQTMTGFRIHEVLSLRLGDVVQHGQVVERVAVARRSMKGRRSGRSVPLAPRVRECLAELVRWNYAQGRMRPDDYLFPSQKGANRAITIDRARQVYVRVFSALRLTGKLGTHCCRKSFGTWALKRAVEAHRRGEIGDYLRVVQAAMGHRSIESTLAYLPDMQEEADRMILDLAGGEA
jgi:integrase